ncbi:MAG: hypothetical protein ABJF23_18320, partial [Bryobacteraceae bacterium]
MRQIALPNDLSADGEAESILAGLAGIFFQSEEDQGNVRTDSEQPSPSLEDRYRILLDQIPAVVFMAYLDEGIGEAYV